MHNTNKVVSSQHLRRFISNALKAAHQAGYTSIAFPAIGTGNLKYDPKMVAKIMVEETLKFSSAVQPTTLKEVRIVLFPSDTATLQVSAINIRILSTSMYKPHPHFNVRNVTPMYNVHPSLTV